MAQAVALARWRRCFALSLAFRLLARIVVLDLAVFFTWGSDLGWTGPYAAATAPFKVSPAPSLATGPFRKLSHPIEIIGEIEQLPSGFRDLCLPR
jgi:hypothetical protein